MIKYSSDLRYVDPFRRYLRTKSKVVRNRAEYWTFFSPSQILGGRPSKSYTHFITIDSRHVAWKKFYEMTPPRTKVIGAHTLNFKQNFKFSLLNFLGGLDPHEVCASKPWVICSACKILRAQHPLRAEIYSLPQKVHFSGSKLL